MQCFILNILYCDVFYEVICQYGKTLGKGDGNWIQLSSNERNPLV